jgi:uncharacterized protein YdaT
MIAEPPARIGKYAPGKGKRMPWTAKSFASRHNKKLIGTGAAADAARQANAMLRSGVDEGIAIATANKRANKQRRSGHATDITARRATPAEKRKAKKQHRGLINGGGA